ncbi:MAG: nucleotidyl transferase AbiEii/AbiGii toxin family protein [Candidatus Eisenbacteria bacterium]
MDFPAPELSGYAVESTIAEKFQAMVKLGILNSRMKDFYDVWMLSGARDFKGDVLAEAIRRTFSRRGTPVTADSMVFDPQFARDSDKQTQWTAFAGRPGLEEAPERFVDVAAAVASFLRPVARAIVDGLDFDLTWKAPGPWK